MSAELRVAIIGAAFGRSVLYPAWVRIPGVRVVALAASSAERARAAVEGLPGVEASGSWQEIVDKRKVDLVSIATPPNLQESILLHALEQGIPAFCEKPLGASWESVQRIQQAFESKGIPAVVDFEFPESKSFKRAKALLVEKHLGTLQKVHVNWEILMYVNKHGISNWKTEVMKGGGALHIIGSHVFYNLEWLFGEIASLRAVLSKQPGDLRDAETRAVIEGKFSNGLDFSVDINTHSTEPRPIHQWEFIGEKGRLSLVNQAEDHVNGFSLRLDGRQLEIETPPTSEDGRIRTAAEIMHRFVRWVRGGVAARPNLSDGLRAQYWIHQCRQNPINVKRP